MALSFWEFMLNFWQICLSDVHFNWDHSLKLAELLALLVYFPPRSLLLLIILLDMSFFPMLQIKLFSPAVNLLVFTTSHFLVELLPNWTDGNSSKQECHRLPLFLLKRPAVFSIHCLLLVELQSLSWLVLTILSIFIGFSCGGRWFVNLLTLPYQSIWYC